ncbi:MAG: hypothetical protein WAX14_20975 [Rhodococcus sp. (in: high G+C Gram-positive bacteria)]|uniref:hypothetical protein n=1 Tax=Rhodococcus sp. TaxID=1831 RepID=UPI003BB7A584
MKKTRTMVTATVAVAAGIALSLGAATVASAAPQTPVSSSPSAPAQVGARFMLLVPNAPVTFAVDQNVTEPGAPTVDGKLIVGTGTTDETGAVAFTFTPEGLAPGTYRLIAATNVPGYASSITFGVQ